MTNKSETLTRMKADTFRARLRLGMGFASPVHVPETLKVRDTAITQLCDALCVDGDLDLRGCTRLQMLPARLVVRGELIIDDCPEIQELPASVRELRAFSAEGCHRLQSIASLVECRGPVDLTGCSSLEPLRPEFRAAVRVKFDGGDIFYNSVYIESAAPQTILGVAPGRRIGELVSCRLLEKHPILQSTIISASAEESSGGVYLTADTSSLIISR